jgi:hypothetical protein
MYDLQLDTTKDTNFGAGRPGIKDVTITYESYGGATRKAEINWTCWSLEQLEKYQKGSFLSIGRNVILDWGWVRSDKRASINLIPRIVSKNGNTLVINEKLFAQVDKEEEAGTQSVWEKYSRDYYGDWAGLVGTVVSFTWTQRDDGGYDCKTDVLGKGSNIFAEELDQPKDVSSDILPVDTYDFNDMIKDVEKELDVEGMKAAIQSGAKQSLAERMKWLDLEILTKYFADDLYGGMTGTEVLASKDQCIFAIVTPNEGDESIELWEGGEEEEIEPAEGEAKPWFTKMKDMFTDAGYESPARALGRSKDFTNDIWVTLGWLEDNIISYYVPFVEEKDSKVRIAEFRSLVREDGKLKSVTMKNHKQLVTYDPSIFILPGQYNVDWFAPLKDAESGMTPSPYQQLAEKIKGSTKIQFQVGEEWDDNDEGRGYVRNILFNLSEVKHAFSLPGTSIQSAVLSLVNRINSAFLIESFEVGLLSGENKSPKRYGIRIVNEDKNKDTDQKKDPKNSFIFENYGFNSLIHQGSLQLSAAVPNKMAIVAGYSSTRFGNTDNDDIIQEYVFGGMADEEKIKAKAVAEFFASAENRSTIADAYDNKKNSKGTFLETFGVLNPCEQGEIKEIEDKGLSGEWNHVILENIDKVAAKPSEKALEAFSKKYEEVVTRSHRLEESNNIDEAAAALNILSYTNLGGKGTEDIYRYPYDASGKLRKHYVRTLQFWLQDNYLSRMVGGLASDMALPITLSMTIDGCGGITPGNMFRLAHLPEVYGQLNIKEGAGPKTYFHMNSVSHVIDESGWKTNIEGQLSKNGEVSAAELEQILKEKYGDEFTLSDLRKKIIAAMNVTTQKMLVLGPGREEVGST